MNQSRLSLLENEGETAVPHVALTSLMDVFTVLVFFLLFNIHDFVELENISYQQLPQSMTFFNKLKDEKCSNVLELASNTEAYYNNVAVPEGSNERFYKENSKEGCDLNNSVFFLYAPRELPFDMIQNFISPIEMVGFKKSYFVIKREAND